MDQVKQINLTSDRLLNQMLYTWGNIILFHSIFILILIFIKVIQDYKSYPRL